MVNTYLTGKCLVSMPQLNGDENFSRSVVYICMHGPEGAMGLVVNKQLKEFYFADLVSQFNISSATLPTEPIILHQGGPLERIRGFVLHSLDYKKEGTLAIDDRFAVSSSIGVTSRSWTQEETMPENRTAAAANANIFNFFISQSVIRS